MSGAREGELPRGDLHALGCGASSAAPPRSTRGRWRALVLLGVHAAIAIRVAHWLHAGRTVTPLEPSEAAVALASRAIDAGILFFALTILTTMVVGRFFCGWACHLVALQDGARWLLGRVGIRPRLVRSRVLALAPFVCAALMFVWPFVARALADLPAEPWRLELTTDDFWGRFPGPGVALATFAVCGFAAVWLLGSKGFCTYACPYGALYGVADRVAPGRIRVDQDACESCGHCTAVCTSNVVVHREVALYGQVVDPGCMKCLDCVSTCPKDALSFGFGALPPKAPLDGGRRPARTYDLSMAEEWLAGGVFAIALASTFRSYGLVPLLLATTLAVLVALAAVLVLRLVRDGEVRFQRLRLKDGGRLTGAGWLGALLCATLLGLTGHTGAVQAQEVAAWQALRGDVEGDARRAAVERARDALERVERWGLVRRAGLSNQLGQMHAFLGEDERALALLERAVEENPEALAPRRKRIELFERAGRFEELAEELWALLALEPLDEARALEIGRSGQLQSLVQGAPEALAPRLLVIEVQRVLGDVETARQNLAAARAAFGDDARLDALERALEAASRDE